LKKFTLFPSQNVTHTLLAFGNNIEIFQFPVRPTNNIVPEITEIKRLNQRGIPEQEPFREMEISAGAAEQKKPLPIVNALSKEFFKELRKDAKELLPGNPKEDEIALSIIKEAYESIGIDYDQAFLGMSQASYLHNKKMKFRKGELSLIREIIGLIDYATTIGPGEPHINNEFSALKIKHDHFFEKKYGESYSYNSDALMFRLGNATGIPTHIVATTTDTGEERKWFMRKDLIAIQAAYTDNPLGYAWLELHFSEILNVKFNICTYCGETFSLQRKRGNGLNKSICGKEICKKELRRQNDEKNRLINPETIRENDKKRKHKSLAYKEIVTDKKTTIAEFSRRFKYPSNEVESWINERKIREKQREAKKKKKQDN
jgi:hypothetical protein